MRGIWLTNVDTQVFNSKTSIREAIELIADTGFDVVFPVVWNKGFTLYRSQVMRDTFGKDWEIAPPYLQQNRDPLREITDIAQQFNLKVIPWFEYGFAYTHDSLKNKYRFELETQLKNKGWLASSQTGNLLIKNGFCWLNALLPEVQDFMINLILELVQNYPVDGIQGDDRLPAFPSEGGYDSATQQNYTKQTGKLPPNQPKSLEWIQWRADILTEFLSRLYFTVKNVNSELIVSIAPHPFYFGLREYLQDIPKWLNLDIVDYIHPQLYRRNFKEYKQLLQETINHLTDPQLAKLYPGLLMKIGNYRLDTVTLRQLINYHRELGIEGEVFFFHEGLRENNAELAKILKREYR